MSKLSYGDLKYLHQDHLKKTSVIYNSTWRRHVLCTVPLEKTLIIYKKNLDKTVQTVLRRYELSTTVCTEDTNYLEKAVEITVNTTIHREDTNYLH